MNKSVFIADDNPMLLATVREVLNSQPGFEVCGLARNGQDAIDGAIRLNPDLIVLDISMPIVNGLDAAHTLRKAMPEVPILLFTIHDTRISTVEALAAGASAIAFKGDGITGLISQARQLLRC